MAPPPQKGKRQSALEARLRDPYTQWQRIAIRSYGGTLKTLDILTGTCLWHTDGFAPLPIRWVLVRDPLGKFQPTAFFSTTLAFSPQQILTCFILRWSLEVTFQECHAHLGLETQRQWSDLAIQRTTPALLALFSLITLMAFRLTSDSGLPLPARNSAWYVKSHPTFSDVIAFVRFFLWQHLQFSYSPVKSGLGLFPDSLLRGFVDSICFST